MDFKFTYAWLLEGKDYDVYCWFVQKSVAQFELL